jgi:hypothetical protein
MNRPTGGSLWTKPPRPLKRALEKLHLTAEHARLSRLLELDQRIWNVIPSSQ